VYDGTTKNRSGYEEDSVCVQAGTTETAGSGEKDEEQRKENFPATY
jgi:hypothetical protein